MPAAVLTFLPLDTDPKPLLEKIPSAPGVGQFLGPEGQSLMLAQPSNLRKWAADHLGLGKPPPPGRRPKTNLSGVARSLGWAPTTTPFAQRLLYERLSLPLVPLSERRDLKPPAFLHLDPTERFPRLSVRDQGGGLSGLFGPFRSRRSAEQARDHVNREFALRPCDFSFEPDPALPLGLGCLYAQVSSCVAPCLERVSEPDYRALAQHVAGWLASPGERPAQSETVPTLVTRAEGSRALVVSAGRREVGLYPVQDGRVLDDAALAAPGAEWESLVPRLRWPPAEGPDDWPWLAAWIAGPRGRGTYVLVADPADTETLALAIHNALPARFARPSADGNVGASQGEVET